MDLEAMDFEELWLLQEQLTLILTKKISAEKLELEKRLAQISRVEPTGNATISLGEKQIDRPSRRKYPKVLPKYYNPSAPGETWSGRGKQPRWLVTALQSGRRLEDFRIPEQEEPRKNATDHEQS